MRRVGWSAIVVFSGLGLAGCLQILGDVSIDSGLDDDASKDATLDTGASSSSETPDESGADAGGAVVTLESGAEGGDGAATAETGADAQVDGDAQTVADGQADTAAEADADAGPDADADAAVCDSATHLANACGGCSTLAHQVDSACTLTDGGCAGMFVCVPGDADAVMCNAPKPNACGGCTTLMNMKGGMCSTKCDSGTWVCEEKTDDLTCSAPGVDPCGGCSIPTGGSTKCVTDAACIVPQGSCNPGGTCSYTQLTNCDGG
ncbi:MAG: hypothetical protein ABSF69_29610 [Polyangiaceae bacterium]